MTRLDRSTAEEPLDTRRTWEPPDEQELAQYTTAPRPEVREPSEDGAGTTFQFREHPQLSEPGSISQLEEEVPTKATALGTSQPVPNNPGQPLAPSANEPQAQHSDTTPVPAWVPEDPTVVPIKARPPTPTPLPSAQPTPPSAPKAKQLLHSASLLSLRSFIWTKTNRPTSSSLQPQPPPGHHSHQPRLQLRT